MDPLIGFKRLLPLRSSIPLIYTFLFGIRIELKTTWIVAPRQPRINRYSLFKELTAVWKYPDFDSSPGVQKRPVWDCGKPAWSNTTANAKTRMQSSTVSHLIDHMRSTNVIWQRGWRMTIARNIYDRYTKLTCRTRRREENHQLTWWEELISLGQRQVGHRYVMIHLHQLLEYWTCRFADTLFWYDDEDAGIIFEKGQMTIGSYEVAGTDP